jgi:hypothetical protein
MRRWRRRKINFEARDTVPRWKGGALVDAAAGLAAGSAADARAVAFAVAQATRRGEGHALDALAAVLAQGSVAAASDEGTLMNVLSALQFASMLPDGARANWIPPRHAVAHAVELGLSSGEALREQTDGLLWALVDRRLAADWLGGDALHTVVPRVASSGLRGELLSQVSTHEPVIDLVADGEEFPCVPA